MLSDYIILKHVFQGQCFIAVDPECFADGFPHRLQQFIDQTRGLKPVRQMPFYAFFQNPFQKDPELPVLVAGDPERAHLEKSTKHGGLIYPAAQVEHLVSNLKIKIDKNLRQ